MLDDSPQNTEFLIIGLGLAGTLTALNLEQRGRNYIVIDSDQLNQASTTGAGIINPLIGKNLNLSWKFSELLTTAKNSYQLLEEELQKKLFLNYPLIRIINSEKQLIAHQRLSKNSEYQKFLGNYSENLANFITPFGAFHTREAHWLNTNQLINAFKIKLNKENKFLSEEVTYNNIKINNTDVVYKNITAQKIIFCDGYQASTNPLAKFMDFRPAKGEIIDLKIPKLNNKKEIYNFGNFLLPLSNDTYRLGATYSWSEFDKKPTLSEQHPLLINLKEYLIADFEIIEIKSAIRPILSGRLPAIGQHPEHSNLFFFNGLGSRGSLQAPYCAKQLIDSILNNKKIDSEISVERFYA